MILSYMLNVSEGSKNGLVYGSGSAVEQLVEEFMSETQQAVTAAPQPFRMDALLQVSYWPSHDLGIWDQ